MSSFNDQISGVRSTVADAVASDNQVTAAEYNEVAADFAQMRMGSAFSFGGILARTVIPDALLDTNQAGRAEALKNTFQQGSVQDLMAEHIASGRSYAEFQTALAARRDG